MRARRAAPRKTLFSATVTPRSATDPTVRVVSREYQRVHRDAFGGRVDDDHIVTRDEHQHICVGRTENRWAFTGDDQIRTDGHAAGQAKRTDLRAVGKSRK